MVADGYVRPPTTAKGHRLPSRAPISPLTMTQKMGFKPIVHCSCGASLDLNTAKTNERRAWVAEHQEHRPQEAHLER